MNEVLSFCKHKQFYCVSIGLSLVNPKHERQKTKPKPKTPKSPQNSEMKISKIEVKKKMVWLLFQRLFLFVWNQGYISHFIGLKKDLEPTAFTVMVFAGVCILCCAMKSNEKELDYGLLWTPTHPNNGRKLRENGFLKLREKNRE